MGNVSPDKQEAVGLAMDRIERRFGKGSIMRLGGRVIADVPGIPLRTSGLDKEGVTQDTGERAGLERNREET